MSSTINHIFQKNRKINNLAQDIDAVVCQHPGLRDEGKFTIEGKTFHKLAGQFYLVNQVGEFIESFEIVVIVDNTYPNCVPAVRLMDDKIDKNEDNHLDKFGVICLDHTYFLNALAKGGIRISDFINHYLPKYFSWALTKKFGNQSKLQEWDHEERGTVQVYEQLVGTTDKAKIKSFLENYCSRRKPYPNDKCYCGSGVNLKKCHYWEVQTLRATDLKEIKKDILLFLEVKS